MLSIYVLFSNTGLRGVILKFQYVYNKHTDTSKEFKKEIIHRQICTDL